MSKEELKQVSDSKTTKTIKKGQPIFEEGEKLNGVYCVRNGVSKLSKLRANGVGPRMEGKGSHACDAALKDRRELPRDTTAVLVRPAHLTA